MKKRTHTCGDLRTSHVGQTVVLSGWVNNYRDHGGVIFIDLRDREGITQVVFHPAPGNKEAHEAAARLRHEDVVEIEGQVVTREAGMANPKLATGEVEVQASRMELLNKAETPPFTPDMGDKTGEETRLKYRFIDLRRPRMQQILRTRHRVMQIMRSYLDGHGFTEIETPFLCRSTPEGARDFLVPSRLQHGSFYALPQSPQLFKQLLMVAGAERYMQIVRCFRDEDPRADRQAEFTQLDLELSFVDQDEVIELITGLAQRVWKQVLNLEVGDIPRMTYAEAMNRFGSDRPDLRFGLELVDVTDVAQKMDFNVFRKAIEAGGIVKAIRVEGGATKLTRKDTDTLTEWVKQFGAGGLPLIKVENGKPATGIAKFIEPVAAEIFQKTGAQDGDIVFFGVDSRPAVVHRTLGELRVKLAHQLGLIREGDWKWLWVVDFPLVEWNPEAKRFDSLHHPFTAPNDDDLALLETDPGKVRSKAYDLVLNGSELGGGSIRIHRSDVQQKIFSLLNITPEEQRAKFGFLLDALSYGAPPHGGLAIGLDRMIMHLVGTTNIRDVIAFPKTQNGADLMTQAPAPVDDLQLKELNLRVQTAKAKEVRPEKDTPPSA